MHYQTLLQGSQGTLATVPDGAAIPRVWALLPWTRALSLTKVSANQGKGEHLLTWTPAPPAQGVGRAESHLVTASRHRQMALCHYGRAGHVLQVHPCMSQLSQRYLEVQPRHHHHSGKPCCLPAFLGLLHRACMGPHLLATAACHI